MGNLLDVQWEQLQVEPREETLVPVGRGALAAAWDTSLVKARKGNAHKPGNNSTHCDNPWYVYERCGHVNFRWKRVPCNKWACSGCFRRRLNDELVPEIRKAIFLARSMGETLKFLTNTYESTDLGGEPTPEGAHRRKLDYQHLAQYIRRDKGETFEYLRVAESHKSGRIHIHALAVMPFIRQAELSDKWKEFARGSFMVDVRAAGMKCPRCYPVKTAPPAVKRRSIIVPPPGKGECLACGYEPDWKSESTWASVASDIAFEMAKYLTKESVLGGVKRKLNRSKGWAAECHEKREKTPRSVCDDCGEIHTVYWDGQEADIALRPGAEFVWWSVAENVAWFLDKPDHGPCNCFGDDVGWRAYGQEERPRPPPGPEPGEPPERGYQIVNLSLQKRLPGFAGQVSHGQ
jgi:hypothetical protein